MQGKRVGTSRAWCHAKVNREEACLGRILAFDGDKKVAVMMTVGLTEERGVSEGDKRVRYAVG